MTQAHIRTKLWLSIGIGVLGFLFTTLVSQVERRRSERELAGIADAALPAAQHADDAEEAFQRVAEEYGTSFLLGDRSGLDRASLDGGRALQSLHGVAETQGISREHAAYARRLAATLTPFLVDADAAGLDVLASGADEHGAHYGHIVEQAAPVVKALWR